MPSSRPATGSSAMGSMKERPTRCNTPNTLSFILKYLLFEWKNGYGKRAFHSKRRDAGDKNRPIFPHRRADTAYTAASSPGKHRSSPHNNGCSHYPWKFFNFVRQRIVLSAGFFSEVACHPLRMDGQVDQFLLGKFFLPCVPDVFSHAQGTFVMAGAAFGDQPA